MQSARRFATASVFVFASMAAMFILPSSYFLPAAFVSTTCMILGAFASGGFSSLFAPRVKTIALGLGTAALLYAIFFAGNLGIQQLHPLGIGSSSEGSIYALIASPGNPLPLQVGVLLFDTLGYESFFRGTLQRRLQTRVGVLSPFAVAAIDSGVHLLTLNPLWVVTTFIADSVWGLTYSYARDLSSSMTSHFVWDIAIFILFPIR
ncbi:MAG: CPBP family glutamic-type intramembrane protease [Nitrososphaerales archaeon]|nr:CPBP family glutamic-type intramembrane protease [Nitrososphaerales archaeon]